MEIAESIGISKTTIDRVVAEEKAKTNGQDTEKRKQMKRLTLLVTALLACAITTQANINETRDQLIKRFGRNQIIKQTANSIAFKKVRMWSQRLCAMESASSKAIR